MNGPTERECRLACFILPIHDGRVLLARHTYGYPDVWAMIGGMAEPGESLDTAARREVREETGLAVSTDRLVAVLDRQDIMIFVFEGRVLAGEESAQAGEIAELRWFTPEELTTANAFDLVVQLAPFLSQGRGLAPLTVAFPDASRRGFAAVASPR